MSGLRCSAEITEFDAWPEKSSATGAFEAKRLRPTHVYGAVLAAGDDHARLGAVRRVDAESSEPHGASGSPTRVDRLN